MFPVLMIYVYELQLLQASEEDLGVLKNIFWYDHHVLFLFYFSLVSYWLKCSILLPGSTRNHQILHSERKKRVELISKRQYVINKQ